MGKEKGKHVGKGFNQQLLGPLGLICVFLRQKQLAMKFRPNRIKKHSSQWMATKSRGIEWHTHQKGKIELAVTFFWLQALSFLLDCGNKNKLWSILQRTWHNTETRRLLLILFVLARLSSFGSSFLKDRAVCVLKWTLHASVKIPQGSLCWALSRGPVMAVRGCYSSLSVCTGHGPVWFTWFRVFSSVWRNHQQWKVNLKRVEKWQSDTRLWNIH